jgi:type IX secretion system PorP/SprF family membrane protein
MRIFYKLAGILLLITSPLMSQQYPIYSHYMMDGFIVNSALAGYDGLTSFDLITRQQWLGIENAPRTFSFSLQTRLLKRNYKIKVNLNKGNRFIPARKGRVGVGGYIYSDRNGYFINNGIALAYAYHISFRTSQLSFGALGSLSQNKIDKSGIYFRQPDPTLNYISSPAYIPDLNIGCFYYKYYQYYIGISASNILQSNIKFGNTDLKNFKINRQYFLIGAYKIQYTKDIEIEPSFLYKTSEGLVMQAELSCKVYYQNKYWGGLSYRTKNTAIMLLGTKWRNLYIGYSFDYDFNAFQRFSYGSHELYLSLKFGDTARRYPWLIRF